MLIISIDFVKLTKLLIFSFVFVSFKKPFTKKIFVIELLEDCNRNSAFEKILIKKFMYLFI